MDKNSYTTVDEYLAQFEGSIREILDTVRATIRTAAPTATERISYRMPCYWQNGPLIYFGAMKDHLGIYPTNEGIAAFKERLTDYATSKGAIRFPYNKPIPYDLIAEITAFRCMQTETKGK